MDFLEVNAEVEFLIVFLDFLLGNKKYKERKEEKKMSEMNKQLKDFGEDAREIIGIKITTSKKSKNKFYSYFCRSNYSNYDVENADELRGTACENVGSSIDLGLELGDIVEFNYGKAVGEYQPIKSVTMLQPSAFKNSGKDSK